jgi:TPR repeat protein
MLLNYASVIDDDSLRRMVISCLSVAADDRPPSRDVRSTFATTSCRDHICTEQAWRLLPDGRRYTLEMTMAVKAYRQAADLGDATAYWNLALRYQVGSDIEGKEIWERTTILGDNI